MKCRRRQSNENSIFFLEHHIFMPKNIHLIVIRHENRQNQKKWSEKNVVAVWWGGRGWHGFSVATRTIYVPVSHTHAVKKMQLFAIASEQIIHF